MSCDRFIQSFQQAEQTLISVNADMRRRFCNVPRVDVWHREIMRDPITGDPIGTRYAQARVQVHLQGMPLTSIMVDHGGRASGFIKVN